jgi:hypothetical protein
MAAPRFRSVQCQDPWHRYISNGSKTVEGRPSKLEKWKDCVGENILLVRPPTTQNAVPRVARKRVTALRHYPNLFSYIKMEWEKAAPQARSAEHAMELYLEVRGGDGSQVFSAERVHAKGGITAIELAQ